MYGMMIKVGGDNMINVAVVDDDGITLEYICKFVRENLNLEKKILQSLLPP